MRRLFIVRKDLHMTTGKISAQLMHCAEAYWTRLIRENAVKTDLVDLNDMDSYGYECRFTINKTVFEEYINGRFTKTVCQAKNKNHLLKAKVMADEIGLIENKDYGLIYDACLTELEPEEPNGTTLTAVWFAPLPEDISHRISKKYHLYIG